MSGQAPLPPRHSSSVVSKGSKVPRATASNVRKPNPVPKAPNPTRPISRAAAIAAAATAQSSNTVGTAPSNRPTRIPAPTTAATLLGINPYIPSLTPPPTPHKAKTWAANTNPRTLRRTLHHNPNHPGTPSKDTVKYTDFPRWSRPATPVPPAPGSENELPSRSTTPILILPPVSPEIVAAPNSPLLSSSVGSSAPSTPCPRHTQKNRSLFHSRRRAFAPHDGVQEYYMSAFKEPPNDLDEIAKSPIFSGGFLIFFRFVFITLATTLGILHLVHQVYTGGVIFWGLLSISGIQVLWGIVASVSFLLRCHSFIDIDDLLVVGLVPFRPRPPRTVSRPHQTHPLPFSYGLLCPRHHPPHNPHCPPGLHRPYLPKARHKLV